MIIRSRPESSASRTRSVSDGRRPRYRAAEVQLADLATTRRTLTALTGEPEAGFPADATVSSVAYQQILAVLTTAGGPMRAKDVCLALGMGTTPKDTERLRAKLKRL